jgi:hypothetical protein
MPQSTLYGRYAGAVAGAAVATKPRQRADPCADDCTPVCPACGGLQCLCRPRFFPGQLLTDEDLNRLERYVVEKNRLHNRYLVGWGVACGLEVVCDACDGDSVVVRTGYALSPCGDDIVVCKDATVNICELIARCKPGGDDCDPYAQPRPRDCRGARNKWVLAICYDERPTRGITALLGSGDDACCSKCGCGGSGSCDCKTGKGGNGTCGCGKPAGDCGCGGPGAGCGCSGTTTPATSKKRKYAPQCEPTQICEGYRFIAYPAPLPPKGFVGNANADNAAGGFGNDLLWAWLYANRSRFGPLLERLLCCIVRALELRSAIREGKVIDGVAGFAVYEEYAGALREFAADFAIHRCSFASRAAGQYTDARTWIRAAGDVARLDAATAAELAQRFQQLDATWLDILAECFCSALLPACPPSEPKNCVPLAVITVSDDPCRVVEICNWEARKILITWRTILYWFSWLPWQNLRTWIASLCCGDKRDREVYEWLKLMIGAAVSGMSTAQNNVLNAQAVQPQRATRRGGAAPAPADPLAAAMNAPNLFAHLAGEFDRLRAGTDENAPVWATLAARLTNGSALAPLAGPAAISNDAQRALAALQNRVNELADKVQAQQAQIERLRHA